MSEDTANQIEGCLSVNGDNGQEIIGVVKRPKTVNYTFYTIEGKQLSVTGATGHHSKLIQHELDHLDGILYIDEEVPKRNRAMIPGSMRDKTWIEFNISTNKNDSSTWTEVFCEYVKEFKNSPYYEELQQNTHPKLRRGD